MTKNNLSKAANAAKAEAKGPAKSARIFESGIKTCGQLAEGMSLLMADLISERVGTAVANSICNAGGKMLKAAELQHRYGKMAGTRKELQLT